MLDCRIVKFRNGEVVALNQDGTPSKLYKEALAYTGNVQKALDLWQTAYTDDFQSAMKNNIDDSATLDDVLKYLDTKQAVESPGLSNEEMTAVVSVMKQFGYKRLSKLYKDLQAIYKPNGVLELDGAKASSSKLYTINDIYDLDIESVRGILSSIEKQGVIADIELSDSDRYTNIVNPNRKNIIGGSERISETEAEEIIKSNIQDFSDLNNIESVIADSDFSEHFSEKKRAALVKKLSSLKRVPEVFITEDGTLTKTDNSIKNEVVNTIPGDLSFEDLKSLKSDVKYLNEISEDTWKEHPDKVRDVLKEVEQSAAEKGINIIGVSEKYANRQSVIDLVDSAVKLLEKPSNKDLLNDFVTKKSDLIPSENKGYIVELPLKYRSYNVVRVNTELSDGEMFDRHSLLKISDGLYHIVNTKNKAEFYENLYQKLVNKQLKGVKTKDVNDKIQAIKDIEAYVMSRNVGFEVTNKEEASLSQLVFEHDAIPTREDYSSLANITTDEDYLKSDFILDFYKYILSEKMKDSEVYRNVLSAFTFSNNDISINKPIKSIEGTKYDKELKDYFSLKKDTSLNNFFKGESKIKLTEEIQKANNPNSVKEFQGRKYLTKGYVIADESVDNIIKVEGKLYKRAKGNVFSKIINANNNYYTNKVEAPYEDSVVDKLIESTKVALKKEETPLVEVVSKAATTPKVDPLPPTNKQLTKYVSQYLKQKLGSDISIMSEADMKRELAKRGYDSLQAMVNQETLLAPNGKPSNLNPVQHKIVRTPEFKAWFGDWENDPENSSKVVDENGEPKVMYTGTSKDKDFDKFKVPTNGVWFTSDKNEASSYAEQNDSQKDAFENGEWVSKNTAGRVTPVFLNIRKMADFNSEITEDQKDKLRYANNYKKLQSQYFQNIYYSIPLGQKRYDGIDYSGDGNVVVVLESPNQIKSAIGNTGAFSTENDKIQFLSTNDKVYGFYDENTKQIFLNESFLTSNSLIHEHWHAFKPILKDLANKGDLQAKLLIDTFRNTVDKAGVFNQAEFEARYDAQNQQKGTDWKSREELTIKREKLNSLIKEAALDLKAGRITNEDFREVVKQNSTIAPITNFIAPATKEQIIKSTGKKSDKVDQPIEEGKMVALRIDIPSLDRHNTWVVTVHEAKDDKDRKGTPISYTNVARIKNVKFNTSPTTSLSIAAGGEKNPIIRMNGNWSELPGESFEEKGKNAQKIVEEIKDNPEWVQVGSNPYRHSYFYDRNNGVPVTNAEEVVQIGGLVYAKNVTYGDVNSPEFTVKGLKDAAGNPVQFSILGDMYSKTSSAFSSEVYNPRPSESKEDYIERMREEIEANLLGENSEAYFERIAAENNLTEDAKKSFKEKLKVFIKRFSDWLANQLGFNNITPKEAAKITTQDLLDRVTTSMLRGDFSAEKVIDNKIKGIKHKASELQASRDSDLEILAPTDLQNIEECK